MSPVAWHRTGGCRCGRLRFATRAAPLITMACHCTGCQRMSASAYSLSLLLPVAGLQITAGEPVIGGLHGAHRHYFCSWCMSWVFTRPDGLDDFVNLRPTMLDDTRGIAPFIETMTREKLPWVTVPAVRSFDGFPTMEEFGVLLGEYREWARA